MANTINLILTSEDFFDAIKFQTLTEVEQVGYVLFYVTKVACLRRDMIPVIIADRIQDQYEYFFQRNSAAKSGYKPMTEKDVENILDNNPDWFQKVTSGTFKGSDRVPTMTTSPYALTQSKFEELNSHFDTDVKGRIKLQNKRLFLDKTLSTLLFVSIFILSLLFAFTQYFGDDDEFVVASVKEYANKIKLGERNPTKKSVLFVYYVTELTKMRKEVNATAIHDRIIELGYEMPSQSEVNKLLMNSEMLHSNDGKTYSLTNLGLDYAEDVVITHIKKPNGYEIPWGLIGALLPIFITLFGFAIKTSYDFGKLQ